MLRVRQRSGKAGSRAQEAHLFQLSLGFRAPLHVLKRFQGLFRQLILQPLNRVSVLSPGCCAWTTTLPTPQMSDRGMRRVLAEAGITSSSSENDASVLMDDHTTEACFRTETLLSGRSGGGTFLYSLGENAPLAPPLWAMPARPPSLAEVLALLRRSTLEPRENSRNSAPHHAAVSIRVLTTELMSDGLGGACTRWTVRACEPPARPPVSPSPPQAVARPRRPTVGGTAGLAALSPAHAAKARGSAAATAPVPAALCGDPRPFAGSELGDRLPECSVRRA